MRARRALVVAGQTQSTAVFEIMGRQGELAPKQQLLRTRYSEGLAAYRARQWDEARRAFGAALEAVPGDGPSSALVGRVDFTPGQPGAHRLEWLVAAQSKMSA